MNVSCWDKRIARAAELEQTYPAAAELLGFYRQLATFQHTVAQALVPAVPALMPAQLRRHIEPLLTLVTRTAPQSLAQSAETILRNPAEWERLLDHEAAGPTETFFGRVLQQPYQETLARRSTASRTSVQPACPFCGSKPVVAILRPEGDGAKRSLLCSLCFTEWDFRRLLCPHCGEEDQGKLPVYTAEEFPHIRVEACDSCRGYIKSVDLTRNGLAVPEVDEVAAIALDLWAAEKGYTKLQPNLFGL
jgi:FdhE protein